jgi:hypothetical protein
MPLAAERPFTYSRLVGAHSIRFVILQPGDFSAPIAIKILQTNLSIKRPFEALSYTWGDQSNLQPITVHGLKRRVLHVGENLEVALRHLRDTKRTRTLWIDALCICQYDNQERNQQVMRMAEIFGQARNVCIWLGEAANHSDEAMEFINDVSHLGKLDRLVKNSGAIGKWHALAELMRRPWFSRRWILQEVAFARKATVYCGMKQVNWSDFSDAVTLFGDKFNEVNKLFRPSSPRLNESVENISLGNVRHVSAHALVTTLNQIVRKAADGRVILKLCNMETLISSFALLQVTNPRDTVYAIMALATDVRPMREPVDYSKSISEVFKDLINHIVNSFGTLDIICRPWAPLCSELPSWATQISRHAFAAGSNWHRINADSLAGSPSRPIYNAGGKIRRAEALWNNHGKGFVMHVQGFVLDTIFSVEQPADGGIIPKTWMEVGIKVVEEREESEDSIFSTLDCTDIPDPVWRTLVADRGHDGSQTPGWYHQACVEVYRRARCYNEEDTFVDLDTQLLLNSPRDDGDSSTITSFLQRVQAVTWNRRLAVTNRAFIGLVPTETKIGDDVCILWGCSVPVILRRHEDGQDELIGECYVENIMDGLAVDSAQVGEYRTTEFKIK